MLHPHDEALLYDLLDGRLAPAAADEVRRRIDDEPELRAAWDDLGRIRAHLRALPTTPVPDAFVASVRARAGLPPAVVASNGSVHGQAPRSIAADVGGLAPREAPAATAAPSDPVATVDRRGEAPVLRMPRWWMAAAAGLGVALGAGVFWALDQEKTSVQHAVETGAAAARGAPSSGPPSPYGAARAESKAGATPVPTAGVPHYGAPGGGVPAGLREPTDAPLPLPLPGSEPGAPPVGERSRLSPPPDVPDAEGAGAGPAPAPGESANTGLAKSQDASTTGGGGGGAVPPSVRPPPPVQPTSGGFPATPAMGDGPPPDPARTPRWKAPVPSPDGSDGPAEGAPRAGALSAATSTRNWAAEGVDDVVVLRADSLDAARAEIALLGDLRDPAVLARLRPRLSRIDTLGCVAPPLADLLALEKVQDKAKAPGAKAAGKAEAPADESDAGRADRRKAGEGGAPSAPPPASAPAQPPGPAGRGSVAPVAPRPPPVSPPDAPPVPAPPAPSSELRDAKSAEEALAHPLGSLRIDLDADAWSRLEAALAPVSAACTVVGEAKDKEAAKRNGKASGDDAAGRYEKEPPAIRRLRILVLPR